MYQKNPTKTSKLRYVFIALGTVVLLGAIAFALEKTGVTNFFDSSPNLTASEQTGLTGVIPSANPTNTVDYSAPKPDDTITIADKNPNPAPVTPTNPELTVVVTNSRKSGDLYLIKAVIVGTDSASCSATMSKGSLTASGNSGTAMIEGQFSCKDLSIPMSQLPETGEWTIVLTVTDKTGATASTSEKVIL
jgi:hypothetical protein